MKVVEGTIKIVSKNTAGILLEEYGEKEWFNPQTDLKLKVIEQLKKGMKVKFDIDDKNNINTFPIIVDKPKVTEEKIQDKPTIFDAEELKQTRIIRESCLSSACNFAKNKEWIKTRGQVIEIAQEFEKWVLRK